PAAHHPGRRSAAGRALTGAPRRPVRALAGESDRRGALAHSQVAAFDRPDRLSAQPRAVRELGGSPGAVLVDAHLERRRPSATRPPNGTDVATVPTLGRPAADADVRGS